MWRLGFGLIVFMCQSIYDAMRTGGKIDVSSLEGRTALLCEVPELERVRMSERSVVRQEDFRNPP